MNPELRARFNTLSRGIESANEAAQENIYTFTQLYIDPCVNGFKACVSDCTTACFPTREDRLRRRRARSRGRDDYHFDFYDDWDDLEEAEPAVPSWGNDELDSLLAGRGQPGRQQVMTYGTRGTQRPHPSTIEDPYAIPKSSIFGFLERLPWKIGSGQLRYKPSAADLQENPNRLHMGDHESEPLIEGEEDIDSNQGRDRRKGHLRQRSDTQASRSTTNSLSSRGDLIMGDEEDDAVPIDDEFAITLSRRATEDSNSSRPGLPSRRTTRSKSSRSVKSKSSRTSSDKKKVDLNNSSSTLESSTLRPTSFMVELNRDEAQARREDELEIAQKREITTLPAEAHHPDVTTTQEPKPAEFINDDASDMREQTLNLRNTDNSITLSEFSLASPLSSHGGYHADSETEPFPSMPTTPMTDRDQRPDPP